MSTESQGLIAELNANATIPDKQLAAIMTTYSSCWGYAAPVKDKQGNKKLLTAATKIPEGWSAKDILDMKSELKGTPEMMEYFGKFADNIDDVCLQPFPCLEDAGGNVTLSLFMEGDYDHWAKDDEPHHTPEYICYRDKIAPLVSKLNKLLNGNVSGVVKELGSTEFQEILIGTFNERGVMYFLAYDGSSQLIEDGNDKRKDEDWGSTSNEVPEVEEPEVEVKKEPDEEKPELSLAEKRALRRTQQGKVKSTPKGVHTTTASPKPVSSVKDTTISEQRIKDILNSSTAVTAKGPFLITLPSTIRTEADANNWWRTNFGTCPNMWKHKDEKGNWVPSYKAGFPYEKLAKGSVLRDKYHPDGSPKSSSKGFAALDDVATGKADVSTSKSENDGDTRPSTTPVRIPVMPTNVRDKVIADMIKLDLKSRAIMTNEEIKNVEEKFSSVYAQLKNTTVQDTWRMTFEEIDRLNKAYPDFGSVWLFALRSFQIQNWKDASLPKEKETTEEVVAAESQELTLAEKRALRRKAANG